MDIRELDSWMRSVLAIDDFARIDSSANGVQVSHRVESLTKIAFAVDASLETFQRCADIGAQALVVHHGLFWGREQVLTGYHYDRVRFLLENDIALYAAHLPLDAHQELGNNYGIADSLGLENLAPSGTTKANTSESRASSPNRLNSTRSSSGCSATTATSSEACPSGSRR
jgi:putative NIF3 family GTP cyclohydrolase 1 type 2